MCNVGVCISCASGQLQCPMVTLGQMVCRVVLSDNQNCGGCGNVCGVGFICDNGACVGMGLFNCGNADGGVAMQVDLQNDRNNCGACGKACIAIEACCVGECISCPTARCGNACVDTQRDRLNYST